MISISGKITLHAASAALLFASAPALLANHPVLLEGNCNNPPAGSADASAGVCGDFDGDGLIGTAEDTDGDRVFGTIAGANGAAGANNNGSITIVTNGTFAEAVTLTGNITLQAAPGVDANIDAVLQGDAGSGGRMGAVGITIDAPASRYVVVRNINIRNWTAGIMISGASNVSIENVTLEHNTNYGLWAGGSSQVLVDNSRVIATGRRVNPGTGDFPGGMSPMPGNGIEFAESSTGAVVNSTIAGNVNVGIVTSRGSQFAIGKVSKENTLFGNGKDMSVK